MNFNRPLILASSSPRRQFLMQQAGFAFRISSPDIDESFPETLAVNRIPAYLAEKKARVFESNLTDEVVLASDTVVILDNEVLNKPLDRQDAIAMLSRLAARTHRVITAVCLLSRDKVELFEDHTDVTFRTLSQESIESYIDQFKPFDKAGAYGAQDCLPAGMNPCSKEEIEFLNRIGKPELIDQTIRKIKHGIGITIIEKIEGAYFTVMGLPLHKVYDQLHRF